MFCLHWVKYEWSQPENVFLWLRHTLINFLPYIDLNKIYFNVSFQSNYFLKGWKPCGNNIVFQIVYKGNLSLNYYLSVSQLLMAISVILSLEQIIVNKFATTKGPCQIRHIFGPTCSTIDSNHNFSYKQLKTFQTRGHHNAVRFTKNYHFPILIGRNKSENLQIKSKFLTEDISSLLFLQYFSVIELIYKWQAGEDPWFKKRDMIPVKRSS